jgi:hypothetical protein
MLVSNLESDSLTDDMLFEEYSLMQRAKHLISLKMDLQEWKDYRLKEF